MLVKHNRRYYWRGEEITEAKYNEILEIVHNRPAAPEGYSYRLTSELEWEQYELPIEAETDDAEATEADYIAALNEMGVEV